MRDSRTEKHSEQARHLRNSHPTLYPAAALEDSGRDQHQSVLGKDLALLLERAPK